MLTVMTSKEDGKRKEGVKKIGRGRRIGVGKMNAVGKIKIGSDLRSAVVLRSDLGWMKSVVARRSGTQKDLPESGLCRKIRDVMRKRLKGTEITRRIVRRCR
jgi:hypothetical protein